GCSGTSTRASTCQATRTRFPPRSRRRGGTRLSPPAMATCCASTSAFRAKAKPYSSNELNAILPLFSSVLSLVFAALVLEQWRQRRRGFQLVWGIGLLWYGIAAGTEFLGSAYGWNE